jgi:hypothetical protein
VIPKQFIDGRRKVGKREELLAESTPRRRAPNLLFIVPNQLQQRYHEGTRLSIITYLNRLARFFRISNGQSLPLTVYRPSTRVIGTQPTKGKTPTSSKL